MGRGRQKIVDVITPKTNQKYFIIVPRFLEKEEFPIQKADSQEGKYRPTRQALLVQYKRAGRLAVGVVLRTGVWSSRGRLRFSGERGSRGRIFCGQDFSGSLKSGNYKEVGNGATFRFGCLNNDGLLFRIDLE